MTEETEFSIYCDGCGKGIDQSFDNYCTPHDPDCPNYTESDEYVTCDCSRHYHNECCPECNCEGDHEKHYGELWICEGCGKRFCWAEGSDDMIELCNKCWLVATQEEEKNKMSNTAQAYLESLTAEHQALIDKVRANRDEEERQRIDELTLKYNAVYAKLPEELSEFYSFDTTDSDCPLKILIPKHAPINVGYWGGGLRYKCESDHASWGRLSEFINLAKQYYREPEPEPEPEPEAPAPKPVELTRVEQAQEAIDLSNYQRAIALALVEVAVQLSEIDRSLVALNSNNY